MLALLISPPKSGKAIVRRITLEQLYFTAVQALPIIVPAALIIGSMIIIQFTKLQGQYDLGKITVLLIIREIGPVVTAMLVILRSASAVTIETGYMKVLHEVDALEMAGLDPIWVLCLPV
jgi:phospholipid/cholesterol/gamma-HCH transport system permease protein